MMVYTILTGGPADIGGLLQSQLAGIIHGGLTSGFCFLSLITWLYSESGCHWPVDLEVFLVRPSISFRSLFINARSAQPRQVRVIEEEEGAAPIDTDERVEELSTWIADLAVRQDDMHSAMDRRFDALDDRT